MHTKFQTILCNAKKVMKFQSAKNESNLCVKKVPFRKSGHQCKRVFKGHQSFYTDDP